MRLRGGSRVRGRREWFVQNPVATTAGAGRIMAVVIRCSFSATMHVMQSVPKSKAKIGDQERYE